MSDELITISEDVPKNYDLWKGTWNSSVEPDLEHIIMIFLPKNGNGKGKLILGNKNEDHVFYIRINIKNINEKSLSNIIINGYSTGFSDISLKLFGDDQKLQGIYELYNDAGTVSLNKSSDRKVEYLQRKPSWCWIF